MFSLLTVLQFVGKYSLLVYTRRMFGIFTNFQMTTLIRLRMLYCKAQNVRDILENIKLNGGSPTCELDVGI